MFQNTTRISRGTLRVCSRGISPGYFHLGCKLGAFPLKTMYETWVLDDSYNKMISVIDMFMTKFPTHEFSKIRICKLRSRYKDFSALLSIGYICSLVDLEN